MNEQFNSMNRCEIHRPHAGRFLPLFIPLAVGFMLGMRRGRMHQMKEPRNSWENGVPPFFAELHRRAHAAPNQPTGYRSSAAPAATGQVNGANDNSAWA
jgi:hypothetical protein